MNGRAQYAFGVIDSTNAAVNSAYAVRTLEAAQFSQVKVPRRMCGLRVHGAQFVCEQAFPHMEGLRG